MVSDYCRMNFTKQEDRFITFAGVAEAIMSGRGWTYVARTWKELWPFDLLWARLEPNPQPIDPRWRESLFKPVIPSWSWAYKITDSRSKASPAVHFLPLRYQDLFDPDTLRLTITSLANVVDFSCPDFMTQHSPGARCTSSLGRQQLSAERPPSLIADAVDGIRRRAAGRTGSYEADGSCVEGQATDTLPRWRMGGL